MSHHEFRKSIALSWIYSETVQHYKSISLSRKTVWDTEDVSVTSTITMDTFNSSKTRATAVNYASVTSTRKLSRVRLDTTLYHYLYI